MGADVYYNISDVEKSVTSVQDLNASIRALLRNVLMNHVVKYELEHIETQKYSIIADVMVSFLFICQPITGIIKIYRDCQTAMMYRKIHLEADLQIRDCN